MFFHTFFLSILLGLSSFVGAASSSDNTLTSAQCDIEISLPSAMEIESRIKSLGEMDDFLSNTGLCKNLEYKTKTLNGIKLAIELAFHDYIEKQGITRPFFLMSRTTQVLKALTKDNRDAREALKGKRYLD